MRDISRTVDAAIKVAMAARGTERDGGRRCGDGVERLLHGLSPLGLLGRDLVGVAVCSAGAGDARLTARPTRAHGDGDPAMSGGDRGKIRAPHAVCMLLLPLGEAGVACAAPHVDVSRGDRLWGGGEDHELPFSRWGSGVALAEQLGE